MVSDVKSDRLVLYKGSRIDSNLISIPWEILTNFTPSPCYGIFRIEGKGETENWKFIRCISLIYKTRMVLTQEDGPFFTSETVFLSRELIDTIFFSNLKYVILSPDYLKDASRDWDTLDKLIRDGKIEKGDASLCLRILELWLKEYFKEKGGELSREWVFPVKGYGFKDIGKGGYKPLGYDFFDGNRHKGHPAVDIFVRDRNQDLIDDITGKPVDILSVSSGVVVAINRDWKPGSKIRGGNYIWIYNPIEKSYFYYAHLDSIFVKPGDIVEPGERIATLGRTGLNAYPKRSPTHLHISYLKSTGGYPRPENIYKKLRERIKR